LWLSMVGAKTSYRPVSAIFGATPFHTFWDIMNGCSKSIGSPEPR
jgi:hypothetical protein